MTTANDESDKENQVVQEQHDGADDVVQEQHDGADDVLKCTNDHDKVYNLERLDDGNYFSDNALSKKNYYPTECAVCKILFKDKWGPNQMKVGSRNAICACRNAHLRDDCSCVHALCLKCFMKKSDELAQKRKLCETPGHRSPRKRRAARRLTDDDDGDD